MGDSREGLKIGAHLAGHLDAACLNGADNAVARGSNRRQRIALSLDGLRLTHCGQSRLLSREQLQCLLGLQGSLAVMALAQVIPEGDQDPGHDQHGNHNDESAKRHQAQRVHAAPPFAARLAEVRNRSRKMHRAISCSSRG